MKYIMLLAVNRAGDEHLIPVIFSKRIDHDKAFDAFQHVLRFGDYVSVKPRSAGFIHVEGNCYGESTTLGIKSHPDDSKIVYDTSIGYKS